MTTLRILVCLILGTLLMLGSCTYDHTKEFIHRWAGRAYTTEYFTIQRNSMERVPVDARIYVQFPTTILGAKADVPQVEYLCDGLQTRFSETYCALRPESREEAMKNASVHGASLLMSAQVIHWNDKQRPNRSEEDETIRDTYFYNNAGVDSIEIGVSIYHVGSKHLFDAVRLNARSAVISGFASQPVELLRRGYQDLASTLASDKIQ